MRAIFKVMLLAHLRDRGAMAMSFLLPPVIFLIFASVFSSAGSGDIKIKLALVDRAQTEQSKVIAKTIREADSVSIVGGNLQSDTAVEQSVRAGRADVGLIVLARASGQGGPLEYLIVQDPTRKVAVSVLRGLLRAAMAPSRSEASRAGQASPQVIRVRSVVAGSQKEGTVAYYAGAVAILFLLFTALQNASSLQEDRESGIFDRIVIGPTGIGALITGKFAFIVFLGLLQVGEIFVAAWLIYGVPLPVKFLFWLLTTLAAVTSAAGLCLLLAASCSSLRQAQTLGNFLILIVSAVGGSMIPRFLMPDWLQSIGWATPNAWALDAYTGVFWRDYGVEKLAVPWIVLTLTGLVALGLAIWRGRRFERQ